MHDAVGKSRWHHQPCAAGGESRCTVPSASDLNPVRVPSRSRCTSMRRDSEGRDYDLVKKGSYDSSGGEYKVEMLQDGRAQCAFKGACTMPRSAAARMWQWGAGSRCGAPRPRHQ